MVNTQGSRWWSSMNSPAIRAPWLPFAEQPSIQVGAATGFAGRPSHTWQFLQLASILRTHGWDRAQGRRPEIGMRYLRARVDAAVVGASTELHGRAGGLQRAQEVVEQVLHEQAQANAWEYGCSGHGSSDTFPTYAGLRVGIGSDFKLWSVERIHEESIAQM